MRLIVAYKTISVSVTLTLVQGHRIKERSNIANYSNSTPINLRFGIWITFKMFYLHVLTILTHLQFSWSFSKVFLYYKNLMFVIFGHFSESMVRSQGPNKGENLKFDEKGCCCSILYQIMVYAI